MNSEQIALFYPLGYLSSLAFGLRFLYQWLYSEVKQKSVVTKAFWWLSLIGNILLFIHSLIQMQFPITLMQGVNGVISWRNLNLMRPKQKQFSFNFTCMLMGLISTLVFLVFYFILPFWFRVPDPTLNISWGWHFIGFCGVLLFSSRFMIQWWEAEKAHKSILGASFWWISLTGGLLSILYFNKINDPVNLIGPLLGMIPYIRNLMLLKKAVAT